MRTLSLCVLPLCLSLFGCRPSEDRATVVDMRSDGPHAYVLLEDEPNADGHATLLDAYTGVVRLDGLTQGEWVRVRVTGGEHSGRVGYVRHRHLRFGYQASTDGSITTSGNRSSGGLP